MSGQRSNRADRGWGKCLGLEALESRQVLSSGAVLIGPLAVTDVTAQQAAGDVGLKSVFASPTALVNGSANYLIQVKNNGIEVASDVVLIDTLPAGTELLKATSSSGIDPVIVDGTATFALGDLEPGDSVTITIAVRPLEGATLVNESSVLVAGEQVDALTQTTEASVAPVAPTIVAFERLGYHSLPTKIVLTFSDDMNATLANNATNYLIAAPGPGGRFGLFNRFAKIRTAKYDAATRTVTLTPWHALPVHIPFQLIVNGDFGGLASTTGIALDGNGDGTPGGNAVITFVGVGPTPTGPLAARRGR